MCLFMEKANELTKKEILVAAEAPEGDDGTEGQTHRVLRRTLQTDARLG